MTGRTHDAIAFASLITIASLNPPESLSIATASASVVANIFGSTLPDIDQATNKIWKFLPFGDHLSKVLSKIFMGHRTFTHSIVGVIFFSALFQYLFPLILNPNYINGVLVYLAFMIGYLSHLVGDAVTKEGLPLLFPLKLKFGFPPFEFLRIKAGGWIENLIILPGVGAYVFWFIGRKQELITILLQKIVS